MRARRHGRVERPAQLPAEVVRTAGLGGRDRLLAAAPVASGQGWLLAGVLSVAFVDTGGRLAWRRPWHEVDRGSWDRESTTLTVTWVADEAPGRWSLVGAREFLLVLRERVQASVVALALVPLPGRGTARAVLRQDLATHEPFEQLVLGPGVRVDAPTQAAAQAVFATLWDDIGMPRGQRPPLGPTAEAPPA